MCMTRRLWNNRPRRYQRGATLVETVVALVIVAVAFAAMVSVLTGSLTASPTPALRQQAVSLAESYLELVLLQTYIDPNQPDTGTCEEGDDTQRALYDDVNDFDCISDTDGARDLSGNLIAGLAAYNIDVNTTAVALNGAPATSIDVVVTHDALTDLTVRLTGYRVNAP